MVAAVGADALLNSGEPEIMHPNHSLVRTPWDNAPFPGTTVAGAAQLSRYAAGR
jgi:hypothetical protein